MPVIPLFDEISQLQANLCSALADHHRVLLVYALAEKPHTVGELAEQIGLSQPTTSRHLKILREQGLISPVRQGVSVEYHLVDYELIQALDILKNVLRSRIARHASIMDTDI